MTNGDIGVDEDGDIWRNNGYKWRMLTITDTVFTDSEFKEVGGTVVYKAPEPPVTDGLATGSVLRGSFNPGYIAAKAADGWWNTNWGTTVFSDEGIIEEFYTCGAGGYVVAVEVKS